MKKKKNTKNTLPILIVILIGLIYGMLNDFIGQTESKETEVNVNTTPKILENISSNLEVYYLDVGQADSILIKCNSEYMLIDAGNNNDGPLLVKYFKSLNINNFKYVVATHPHEDHIGGLDDIIKNFDIDTLYMANAITTTKTFENVLDALEEKNMTYKVPKLDTTLPLGDAYIKVIYTDDNAKDLNDSSIVLKLTYKNNTFLFTGDLSSKEDDNILNKDISAQILKVSHHGSKYSTTSKFLDKVDPKYAIISVGKNNIYNHPSDSTISKLKERNIKIYRTDELGTILIKSDGNNINISNFNTDTDGD